MEKERLKEAANAEKVTEGARFWAERMIGRGYGRKSIPLSSETIRI
jgi:hypothetical protein